MFHPDGVSAAMACSVTSCHSTARGEVYGDAVERKLLSHNGFRPWEVPRVLARFRSQPVALGRPPCFQSYIRGTSPAFIPRFTYQSSLVRTEYSTYRISRHSAQCTRSHSDLPSSVMRPMPTIRSSQRRAATECKGSTRRITRSRGKTELDGKSDEGRNPYESLRVAGLVGVLLHGNRPKPTY